MEKKPRGKKGATVSAARTDAIAAMTSSREGHFNPLEDKEFEFDVTQGLFHPHLAVRWGGREVLQPGGEVVEHRNHQYAYVKYCLRGSGVLRYGSTVATIEPGMVFWSRDMMWSRLDPRGDRPMVNLVVFLFGRDVKQLFEKNLHSAIGATRLQFPHDVEAVMSDLMVEGLASSDYRDENAAALAEVLLRRIDSNIASTIKPQKLARQTYWECRKYIDRNYVKISELKQVADACDVTVPYICRLFDQFDKLRPYEYITQRKLSQAERLLTRTQLSVTEISARVGYRDLQLFSRNFKIRYGKSPRAHRKQHA